MARTIWVAVFCLATLGAGAAIRIAAPSASSVEPGSHPRKLDPIDLVLAPNESAKSDRLPLPDIRAETEPETIPGRHWQDANAKASPGEVDIGSREMLLKAIQNFEGTVMLVSHDRHFLKAIATRVFEVDHGELRVYEGNFEYYTEQKAKQAVRVSG